MITFPRWTTTVLSRLRTALMGIGAFGYFVLVCAIAFGVPSLLFSSLHRAARLAVAGKAEQRIVSQYLTHEAGSIEAPGIVREVIIHGFSEPISVGRTYKENESVVFLSVTNSKGVTMAGVIDKDNLRIFRLIYAQSWGDPRPLFMNYAAFGIAVFLLLRCLALLAASAVMHGKAGLRSLTDSDWMDLLVARVRLGSRTLLILTFGLMVLLATVVAVRSAIAVERRPIVSGLIYFTTILLIGSRSIPKLSQWTIDFVQGQESRRLREVLVSLVFLFAVLDLIKALSHLLFHDVSKWESWKDVLKALWDVLLS